MYFSNQIRQINFFKKKLQRKACWRRQRKKKKRKKIFNEWQKKRETYAQGEACSSTERAELREEMRGVRELACAEQKDEMRGMRHCAWDSEDTLPFIEGQFGNCQLTPNRYIKRPRTFNKMDHQSSKYQTHATFSKKLCFILTKHYFWADFFGLIFLKTQLLSFKSWNKRVLNSLGCERMQVLLLIDWVSLGLLVLSLRYMYLFL